MNKRYGIIGASAAGLAAATKIFELDPTAEVLCFSTESQPYNTCFLTRYAGHEVTEDKLVLLQFEELLRKGMQFFPETPVTALNTETMKIVTENNTYSVDRIIIATGAQARIPSWYKPLPGVFLAHTLQDIMQLREWCAENKPQRAVIIGSGFTGIEMATGLQQYGCTVTLLEQHNYILPSYQQPTVSAYIQNALTAKNYTIGTSVHVTALIREDTHFTVQSSVGNFEADVIIIACGVTAATQLAQHAGLAVGAYGITVNNYMQTSAEYVFAAGDCAEVPNLITQKMTRTTLWPDAVTQGMRAGANAVECNQEYSGSIPASTIKYQHAVWSFGGVFEKDLVNYPLEIREQPHFEVVQYTPDNKLYAFFATDRACMSELRRELQRTWSIPQRSE